MRNIKAQLRGALRAIAAPATMPSVVKELGLEGAGAGGGTGMVGCRRGGSACPPARLPACPPARLPGAERAKEQRPGPAQQRLRARFRSRRRRAAFLPAQVATLTDELLKEGALAGTLKGGGVNWTPACYASAQQEAATSFYNQNGWVAYDMVGGGAQPPGRRGMAAPLAALRDELRQSRSSLPAAGRAGSSRVRQAPGRAGRLLACPEPGSRRRARPPALPHRPQVRRTGIPNERAFLKTKYPEGLALESAYVSGVLLDQVDTAVEEACAGAQRLGCCWGCAAARLLGAALVGCWPAWPRGQPRGLALVVPGVLGPPWPCRWPGQAAGARLCRLPTPGAVPSALLPCTPPQARAGPTCSRCCRRR